MKTFCKIGPMWLLEVKAVYEKRHLDFNVYIINFGAAKLAATSLHAFRLDTTGAKCPTQLNKGDKIWVDSSAFLADGSLTIRSGPTKRRK